MKFEKSTFKLIVCLILMGSMNLSAQDVIVKNNGELIKSRVIEITDVAIKYRKFDNLTGPIYNVNKIETLSINYENGNIEVFTKEEAVRNTPVNRVNNPANTLNRQKNFQFYDNSVSFGFIRGFGKENGIFVDYEKSVSENASIRIPMYIMFDDYAFSSSGINLKYYFYRDTWISAFAGPEVTIGYYFNSDITALPFQVIGDFGIAITPLDNIKITMHTGLGYGTYFNVIERNVGGFASNFNIGLGYNF